MTDLEALGNELREARQARDLTLREVERRIHIRAKYLEALESGQLEALPSPVQGRGFLGNYARYLQLDAEQMIARWDEALLGSGRRRARRGGVASVARSTQQARTVTVNPAPYASSANAPRRGRRLLTVVAGLALLLLIGTGLAASAPWLEAILGGESGADPILSPLPRVNGTDQDDTPTPDNLPTDPPPRPTPLPNPNVPAGAPPPALTGDVILQLEVIARTWLRVTVDGQVSYQGAPGPNTILQYRGNVVSIRASNGAGLRAIVNNRDLGILGARGQIVDQSFTAASLLTPSPFPEMEMEPPPTEPPVFEPAAPEPTPSPNPLAPPGSADS